MIRFTTERIKRAVGSPEGASCWGEEDLAGSPKGGGLCQASTGVPHGCVESFSLSKEPRAVWPEGR